MSQVSERGRKSVIDAVLTGLGNSNQIMSRNDCWNRIGLDWSGNLIAAQANVLPHDRMQAGIIELYSRV